MKINPIMIGQLKTKNNLFLAPMAGFTNYAFRHTILPFSVGFCYTELISAKGLFFGGKNNDELVYAKGDEDYSAIQLFGNDPYYLRKACESEILQNFKVIDINMGCPVPKIYKNGEGSALLKDINLAENIIKECVKSGKYITIKIRTGLKKGDNIAEEFCKMAEQSGAKLVTIHGRVREDYYSGVPDYNAIEQAKNSVEIPIIANGGIFSVLDADKMINNTGVDGIMIARGAISNPFLFNEICGVKNIVSLKNFVINFFTLFCSRYGEKRGITEFRKYASYFYKNYFNGKEIRMEICSAGSQSQILEILKKTL